MVATPSHEIRLADARPPAGHDVKLGPLPFDIGALFSLAGQVAVLTDSAGTGSREVALLLAAAGARVFIAEKNFTAAQELVAELDAAGHDASAIDADIEDEGAVEALFRQVDEAAGRIDILVNCAAMTSVQLLAETTAEQWDDVQSLNLRANFLCMRAGVRQMVAGGRGGHVVNISSIAALQPVMFGNEAYGAARAGLTALSRNAALNYAKHGIRINTVLAGPIPDKVPFHETTLASLKAGNSISGPIAIGDYRMPFGSGHMTDVAAAVLYLVAPSGRYITGQSLVLDGGFLLT